MTTATLQLTPEQTGIFQDLRRWAENEGGERTLAGLAGTGKTTLVGQLCKEWEASDLQVLSPTGKAASVLRSKGIEEARTLHSWLYTYLGSHRDERTGRENPQFADKGTNGSGLLLIVDESSMVTQKLANDLRRTGGDILWVGDHGQLAPIGQDPGIMSRPDYQLKSILRQAKDSPIIQLAYRVRTEGTRAVHTAEKHSDTLVCPLKHWGRFVDYCAAHQVDMVLCGYNKTRHLLNRMFRAKAHGKTFEPGTLVAGDRLVCLMNDYRWGVFNGETFTVEEVIRVDGDRIVVHLIDCNGQRRHLCPLWSGSLGTDPKDYDRDEAPSSSLIFDYGYALTAHKAQGSEWGSVAVVWEPFGQGPERWGYTAITRAKQRLIIGTR